MVTMVLDGYNVIHAVPELARQLDRSLEAAREALMGLCRTYRARSGDIERLYVVFDGDDAHAGWPQEARGGVTALFTCRQEEADERILSLIRTEGGRRRCVVVSDDVGVSNNARALGARVLPVRQFYQRSQPAGARRPSVSSAAGKTALPASDARRITEEYLKHLEAKGRRPR